MTSRRCSASRSRSSRAAALLCAAALEGCAATPSPPLVPIDGPVAVAAGAREFFLFDRDKVELRGADGVAQTLAAPAGAGAPAAVSVDLERGWACVACRGALAIVQLADRQVTWATAPLAEPPLALAVSGDLAAVLSRTSVAVHRLPGGELLWRETLAPWLKQFRLDEARCVLPLSEQEFLLVGARSMRFNSNSEIVVQKIDRSQGQWRVVQQTSVPGLTFLHACASDGHALYLAGVHEEMRTGPMGARGQGGALLMTFVIVGVDPATMNAREIVWDERHAHRVLARQLAVGKDLVAVRHEGGELEIYRLVGEGRSGAPMYEGNFGPSFSAAWLSPNDVVVVGAGEPRIVRVQ